MTVPTTTTQPSMTVPEAERFVYDEAALLDAGHYDEWLEMFTTDAIYWVPANDADNDPRAHVAIIYDTYPELVERVARYQRGRIVQQVPSRTVHVVSNIVVTEIPDQPDAVQLEAATVIYEVHTSRKNFYPGRCTYHLTRRNGKWKIASKKLTLIDNDQFYANLAFVY